MSDSIIQINQDLVHTELKDLVRNSVEEALNAEADKLVNADRYARVEVRKGYRSVIMTSFLLLLLVRLIFVCQS